MPSRHTCRNKATDAGDHPPLPPLPATEWGDEPEFKRAWGKSLDEVIEEANQASESGGRVRFDNDEDMLAHLQSLMKRRANL